MSDDDEVRNVAARAGRVLAHKQSGRYGKRMMAHDILWLTTLVRAHRREFLVVAADMAREANEHTDPVASAENTLACFEAEVLAEHAESWNESADG